MAVCAAVLPTHARREFHRPVIINLCAELSQQDLNSPFEFTSTKGIKSKKLLSEVLLHVFNHQTHHRGQATTLFSQVGIDVGATDLLMLIPNMP